MVKISKEFQIGGGDGVFVGIFVEGPDALAVHNTAECIAKALDPAAQLNEKKLLDMIADLSETIEKLVANRERAAVDELTRLWDGPDYLDRGTDG